MKMKLKLPDRLRVVLLVSLIVTGCQATPQVTPTAAPAYNSQLVELTLRLSEEHYQIGESFEWYLRIENRNAIPIQFPGFAYGSHSFGFSSPNAIHLIDPDGRDVMLPYAQLADLTDDAVPIEVQAQDTYWLDFAVPRRLRLRQPGRYTLWFEMQDNFGTLQRSNAVSFDVVDVEPSVSPELLELTLEFEKLSCMYTDNKHYEVIFTNKSDQPLVFLRPQYEVNLHVANPVYELTVIDHAGRTIPWAGTELELHEVIYDEHTQVTVAPGAAYREQFSLPHYAQMLERAGEYRIRVTYIVLDYDLMTGKPMDWGTEVFVGRLESNEVIFKIIE